MDTGLTVTGGLGTSLPRGWDWIVRIILSAGRERQLVGLRTWWSEPGLADKLTGHG